MERIAARRVHKALIGLRRLGGLRRFVAGGWKSKQEKAEAAVIRSSTLFDEAWYLQTYPDVGLAKTKSVVHYVRHGWKEGRDPGPNFSTNGYLRANPDVDAADINPLLHFLEHGQSEGRSAGEWIPAVRRRSKEDFGPAHPCHRSAVAFPRPAIWTRTGELVDRRVDIIRIGDVAAGYYVDQNQCDEIEVVVQSFRRLSGDRDAKLLLSDRGALVLASGSPHHVIDAWYTTDFTMRLRWQRDGEEVFAIRVFQLIAGENMAAALVGEAIIDNPLGLADLNLATPYAPLLIVECESDGMIRGASILPFPSLCRGGAHYSELLSLADSNGQGPIDVLGLSRPLAIDLAMLMGGEPPLVSNILVDLRGADGTETIFKPEFHLWLSGLFSIGLLAGEVESDRDEKAAAYLKDAVETHGAQRRDDGGFRLVIRSNEIPTIGILTACRSRAQANVSDRRILCAPFIVTTPNESMPKFRVSLPQDAGGLVEMASRIARSAAPILAVQASPVPPPAADLAAAIRMIGDRPVHDAELLTPVGINASPSLIPTAPVPTIAVICVAKQDKSAYVEVVEALGRQNGADRISLILLGANKITASLSAVCDRFFPSQWACRTDLLDSPDDALGRNLLWIGQDIVMHDPRTVEALGAIVENDDVLTAGCAIVQSAAARRGWSTIMYDAGAVRWTAPLENEQAATLRDPNILPQAIYPVAAPMTDLWMARSERIEALSFDDTGWKITFASENGHHVCTSLVTAALLDEQRGQPISPLDEMKDSTRAKVLLG
jgi:hypothetical protein